jgi:hypothetical protein
MSTRMGDTALVEGSAVTRTPRWRAQAVEEYERSLPARRAGLRTEFATRLLALTGRALQPDDLYVDTDGRLAVASTDNASFRLYRHGGLVLVRPCAYCGTGRFESPKISDLPALGYALAAWRPLHEDCEHYPPEDFPDF